MYSANVIKLAIEIRRRLPESSKHLLCLSDPELMEQLLELFHLQTEPTIRQLIERVMEAAGPTWLERLSSSQRLVSSHHLHAPSTRRQPQLGASSAAPSPSPGLRLVSPPSKKHLH
ncbi:hypothetical protein [Aurantivibrio plasticivorans]